MADIKTVIIDFESNIELFTKQLAKLEKGTKSYNDQLESLEVVQKEYDEALIESAKSAKIFGTSLNDLKNIQQGFQAAMRLSVRSLGAFKTALAATGIGLIVIALAGLVGWLTKTQKGMDLVTKVTNQFAAVLEVLLFTVIDMAKAMFEMAKGITNVVRAFVKMDFQGIKNGWDQITEGANDYVDALGNVVSESQFAIDAAARYSDALVNLDIEKNKNLVVDARLLQASKDFNKTSEDTTLSLEVRAQASRDAEAAEEERVKAALALNSLEQQTEKLRRANDADISREEEAEFQALIAERLLIQRASDETQTTQQNKTNSLEQQIAQANADALALIEFNYQENLRINRERRRENRITEQAKAVEDEKSFLQKIFDLNKIFADAKAARDAQAVQDEFDNNQTILSARATTAEALASIAGSESLAGKALAIAAATINTYAGANAVLGNPLSVVPFSVRIAQAIAIIATGLANVKQIIGTPIPTVRVSENQFAHGGMIRGRSHANGGVHIEAEGGEAIINKRSMRIAGVREAASHLNELGGGVRFANGGIVPQTNEFANVIGAINRAAETAQIVLVTEDLDAVQNQVAVTSERSTL